MDEDEDEVLELLSGTVIENNRNLRRKLIDYKKSRDKFLYNHHYSTLQSFLPESVSIIDNYKCNVFIYLILI